MVFTSCFSCAVLAFILFTVLRTCPLKPQLSVVEAGGYGTVCGLNSQAANVACRQIGFEFGVVSPAQASAAQAVPLLLQKPCSVQAQR